MATSRSYFSLNGGIMFVLVENDSITKTLNSSRGITIGENQYPRAIYTLWSTAEREAIGIYEVVFDNSNQKLEDLPKIK